MRQESQTDPPKAHLDVDWLVGKRSDPRLRLAPPRKSTLTANALGTLLGLAFVGTTILVWPSLSTHWLQRRLLESLQSSNAEEDTLAVMLALQNIGADNQIFLEQLNELDPNRQAAAFQILSEQIAKMTDHDAARYDWASLLTQIVNLNPTNASSNIYQKQLIEQINLKIPSSHAQYDSLQQKCLTLLNKQISRETSQGNSNNLSQFTPVSSRPAVSSSGDNSRGVIRSSHEVPSSSNSIAKEAAFRREVERSPLPSIDLISSRPKETHARIAQGVNNNSFQLVSRKQDVAPSQELSRDAFGSSQLQSGSTQPISNPSEDVRSAKYGASYSASDSLDDSHAVSGLDKQSIENLFAMLASPQERRVRLVCDELFRRGVPALMVEGALELARGDSERKLEIIEQMVRINNANPVPILSWLAQSSDRTVRQRAIAILGSIQDPEAQRRLRSLIQREPDQLLQSQIQQALLTSKPNLR